MAANRGEIAIRIFRAATEMNIKTVAIYSVSSRGTSLRYEHARDSSLCSRKLAFLAPAERRFWLVAPLQGR